VIYIPNLRDIERAFDVTWGKLTGPEPQLNELLWQARTARAGCRDREDVARAFAPFRNALADLIVFRGSHESHPVLGSVGAYEVAYWRLHGAICGPLARPAAVQEAGKQVAEAVPQWCRAPAPAGFLRLFPALLQLTTFARSPGV
jgi:hypothetical protein